MANLTSYTAVKSNFFVKLTVEEYRNTSNGSFAQQVFEFTDAESAVTIGSDTYTPIGELLGITATSSELRPTSDQITVSITGVPTANVPEVLYSKIKGSRIEIRRQFRNPANDSLLSTQGYFFGRVNNWSIQEEHNVEERSGSTVILFECSNQLSVLENKISGRLTNPESNKTFFPNDTGMDRVPIIKGTKFDFGAP